MFTFCRSKEDKCAFIVHAYVVAQGYKLVATGADSETDADFSTDMEEVNPARWNTLPGLYSFRYQDAEGKRPPLYLKCIPAGPKLLVQWATGPTGSTQAGNSHIQELQIDKFTTDAPNAPAAYQNTDELMRLLDTGLGQAITGASSSKLSQTQPAIQPTRQQVSSRDREEAEYAEPSRGYSPLQESPPRYPGGYRGTGGGMPQEIFPAGVGYEDVVPPGVRPPGFGGGVGGIPGLTEGPPHMGGGMHVGPGHPMFAQPGRAGVRPGMYGDHGAPPPGTARYDPIAPPGMRGFRPEDFQRDPSKLHPDVMQPGPGKGTDWTSYYG